MPSADEGVARKLRPPLVDIKRKIGHASNWRPRVRPGTKKTRASWLTPISVSDILRSVPTYQADGWTALGDPTRRAIFECLVERPRAVGELASEFPVSRPAVSQHLRVLKDARLVTARPAGNRRIYEVDPTGLGPLRADLERFWGQALANYKRLVERRVEEDA
ncbi:MAG TPA: metalloregulator ArsR/SmtB family transcription factor [Solirubrobacteraceae bacterium]|nr:metalloregulator ArsR/SmtB family transcription factor [Solirubrobacteraceae bacterium]